MTDQEVNEQVAMSVMGGVVTDSEINKAVARKLGWKQEIVQMINDPIEGAPCNMVACYSILPDYCHSIEAAWEIVEQVNLEFSLDHMDGIPWRACFNKDYEAEADTAPMAICKAFL